VYPVVAMKTENTVIVLRPLKLWNWSIFEPCPSGVSRESSADTLIPNGFVVKVIDANAALSTYNL